MLLESAEITPPVFQAINLFHCVNGSGGGRGSQVGMNVCLCASSNLGEYMAHFREAPAKSGIMQEPCTVCACVRAYVEGFVTNAKEISVVSKALFGANIMG